ncbi:MAG: HTTM domain-containing protein [Pirellulales bacterium]
MDRKLADGSGVHGRHLVVCSRELPSEESVNVTLQLYVVRCAAGNRGETRHFSDNGSRWGNVNASTQPDRSTPQPTAMQHGLRGWLRRAGAEVFGLDLRSLALLRVGLGVLILVDLACRARDLVAHYTDDGVLPREAARELIVRDWRFSLHMLGGSAAYEAVLFLVAALVAVLLVLGWRTRLMTLLSWLLMISLHARNPVILNGGDLEFKLLLFWGLFLPLGARWSIDRLLSDAFPAGPDNVLRSTPTDIGGATGGESIVSMGTLAYVVQIIFIYVFAGLLKSGDTWAAGTAVEQAMHVDFYGRPLRQLLLDRPELMRGLTHFTLYLELYGPLLLLVPWRQAWLRLLTIVLFVGMHLSFELTLTLGMFPWVSMTAWLALLPAVVWNNRVFQKIGSLVQGAFEGRCAATVRWLVGTHVLRPRPMNVRLGPLGSYTALFFLVLTTAWNAESVRWLRVPEPFRSLSRYTHTNQGWGLFAPNPATNDGWCIVALHLADGSEVDMLTGEPLTFNRPEYPARLFPNHRWRKYFKNLVLPGYVEYRPWYARYVGQQWNRQHGDGDRQAETLLLIYMQESPTAPATDDPRPVVQHVCWRHWYRDELRSRFYPGADEPREIPLIVFPLLEDDAAEEDSSDGADISRVDTAHDDTAHEDTAHEGAAHEVTPPGESAP